MSAALPNALRVRFQEYVEEGLSGRAAAARLNLSPVTGVRWLRRIREAGTAAASVQGRPKGHGKLAPHRVFWKNWWRRTGTSRCRNWPVHWKRLRVSLPILHPWGAFCGSWDTRTKKVAGCHRTTACPCETPAQGLVATPDACHAGCPGTSCLH